MAEQGPGGDELTRLRERIDALEGRPAPVRHRTRSACALVLIVLGCLLAPLALVATWTADLADDTDRYVATVAPLARDRAVQDAAADRITGALMRYLDLAGLLKEAAPADRPLLEKAFAALGGSLDDAVSGFVRDKAREVVASETFARFWTDANRRLHTTVDKALTGSGGGAVRIEGDAVTVDLAPVVAEVRTRLVDAGLKPAAKIPDVHTDFTVLRTEKVADLRTYFRLLRLAGIWLPVIAALLLAGGVLLAVRRRRALVAAALGFAVTALLLGLGLTVFRAFYLDALPAGVSQPAAGAVYDTLTRFLRTAVRAVIALGVVLALAAWLSGPGRRARAVREVWHAGLTAARTQTDRRGLRTGPVGPFVHRHRVPLGWLLVAGAVIAFVLWPHPTGWVVLGLALALLFALAVVDFVGAEGAR
ncbi:hypothetical protein ACFWN1_04865 [Streptomyces sp. NPDC058459]|uniref:hypothetical protein n=1 Tax=Streptomyces sp. NPDC058459 TaxID=3346508 RepID=UPI0036557703